MKELISSYLASTDPEQESWEVVRHLVFGGRPAARPQFLMRHVYRVSPEHASTAVKRFTEICAPVYDSLPAAGSITGYRLAVQEMPADSSWTHTGWTTIADLAQLDGINRAFEEADTRGGEVSSSAVRASWLRIHDSDAHRDSIMCLVFCDGR